ncbi:MAG: hypothetical protein GX483_01265 [Actinomycetaceae bacterium]|nr:hypothetical protein [Actinomycetaceae bacterium]
MSKRLLALLSVLTIILAGCAGLPRAGEPQVVEKSEQYAGGVVLDPQGPAKDASAEDIVSGFMRASSAGFSDDFVVARQYLTPEAAATWNPTTQVRIYPDSQNQSVTQTRSGAYRVTVGAGGILDTAGRYTASAPDAVLTMEFSLLRDVDGQWRIAVLDDGVTMPESLFQSLFAEAPIYFLSADQTTFVPDLRWYPRADMQTALAQGIIDGPSSWLSSSVRTILPADTTLGTPTVKVDGSTAIVDLRAQHANLSESELTLLYAQFTKTYSSMPNISDIDLRLNGSVVKIPSKIDLQSYPYSAYKLLALLNGNPVTVGEDKVTPLMDAAVTQGLQLTDLAVGYTETPSWIAAIGNEGTTIYHIEIATETVATIYSGTQLVPPSVDSDAYVWTSEESGTGELVAISTSNFDVRKLSAPWLEGATIRHIAISREGARIALLVERDDSVQLLLAGIQRERDGTPIAIGDPVRYGQRLTDISDIAWVSDARLVAIGKSVSSPEGGLFSVPLGAPIASMSTVDGMVHLTAGRGDESIILETTKSELFTYDAGAWRLISTGVTAPTYPG